MWKDKLEKVQNKRKEFFGDSADSGVPIESIALWRNRIYNDFKVTLPAEYIDILKVTNGVEWNGFVWYGVDKEYLSDSVNSSVYGLIEQNEIWYENPDQKKYIFYGESNISWYVYDVEQKCYIELDNPSGREMHIFDSFEALFEKFLDDSLL